MTKNYTPKEALLRALILMAGLTIVIKSEAGTGVPQNCTPDGKALR